MISVRALPDGFHLTQGGHHDLEDGACLLELASYLSGEEEYSDHPGCVCPILATFGRNVNDSLAFKEHLGKLQPLAVRLIGTRDATKEKARAYLLVDWAVRTVLLTRSRDGNRREKPTKFPEEIEALEPIVDDTSAARAWEILRGWERRVPLGPLDRCVPSATHAVDLLLGGFYEAAARYAWQTLDTADRRPDLYRSLALSIFEQAIALGEVG